MFLDDASCHPQSEASPLRALGSEEWLEDTLDHIPGDSRTVIRNGNAHAALIAIAQVLARLNANPQHPFLPYRIESVGEQIRKYLPQFPGKSIDWSVGFQLFADLDLAGTDLRREQAYHFVHQTANLHGFHSRGIAI